MAKKINHKCWSCSMLSLEEALQHHGPEGDGCWSGQRCHNRRSYYRHRQGRMKAMKQRRSGEALEPATLTIDSPEIPAVVLYTYADKIITGRQSEVVIHAMRAELWVGQQHKASSEAVHTFGWPPKSVKAHAQKILQQFYEQYGNGQRYGFERFASQIQLSVSQCPIRPCPFHLED